MAEKVKCHFDCLKSQSKVICAQQNYPLQTRDLFDRNDLFSDFKVFSFARYDPCLSFSTEHWYDIWPTKQMDPLKKKQIVLQVHVYDSCYCCMKAITYTYMQAFDGLQPIPRDLNYKGMAAMLDDTSKRR